MPDRVSWLIGGCVAALLLCSGGPLGAAIDMGAVTVESPRAYSRNVPLFDAGTVTKVRLAQRSPAEDVVSHTGAVMTESVSPSALLNHPTAAGRASPDSALASLPSSVVFPEVSGLAGAASDEGSIPWGNTASLSLGPGGFGRILTGRPASGGMAYWTDANETALSYIRPHVNIEMMLTLELPGAGGSTDFEGAGMVPRAFLEVDHLAKVDSRNIGSGTEHFGGRQTSTPVDEPQSAVAVGLDLGILPTFLSQMGLSVSLVASRGQETGSTRLALVGTTELPIDWATRERPIQNPVGKPADELVSGPGSTGFPSGGGSGSGGAPETTAPRTTPPTPITPTPEPATLGLLVAGLAGALAARRRRR
jgi:hypothetical protein